MQRISIQWTPTACEDTQKFLRKQPEKKKKLKKALRLLSEQGPQYPSFGYACDERCESYGRLNYLHLLCGKPHPDCMAPVLVVLG